jgi:TIR domain
MLFPPLPPKREVSVFYSYAHEDERFVDELEKQLGVLKRTGVITTWHDRKIRPGGAWEGEIDERLESAQVILLLVSADFVNSDYCYEKEMVKALQLHALGKAVVIPIVLKEVAFLDKTPFAKIQMLPRDAKPITHWKRADKAWAEVAEAIGKVCEELQERSSYRGAYSLDDDRTAQAIYEQIAADAKRQQEERREIMKQLEERIFNASLPQDVDVSRLRRADKAFNAMEAYIRNSASDDKAEEGASDPPGPHEER